MEYAAADTPIQNSLIELKFTHQAAKARAALNATNVLRKKWELFHELISTMTKLDWLKLVKVNRVERTELGIMVSLSPNFPSIFGLGEKRESSRLVLPPPSSSRPC